ncbi:peptidase inhibitor family I36 protein [Rugosimonospora africana]|nr:peptidase inhibitor family I36 protein [Rugosimonospora africana]
MIRTSRVVMALAAVFTGVLVGASTAVAAQADVPCPPDSLCLYEDKDFGGYMIAFPAGSAVPSLHEYLCLGCNSSKHPGSNNTWGDMLSSWRNTSDIGYCQFRNIDYNGNTYYGFLANYEVSYVGKGLNDEISSFHPAPCPEY